jgi:hypothetical protein
MSRSARWEDREDYVLAIERATSTLNAIADACGKGAYTGTERVEDALLLISAHISSATERLRLALWPEEKTNAEGRSAAYLEYRRRFDAWLEACDTDTDVASAGKAWQKAIDDTLARPIRDWNDVAELGIVAHDHAWDRFSQAYNVRGCPEEVLRALILGVLALGGIQRKHPLPRAGWKSPLTISN